MDRFDPIFLSDQGQVLRNGKTVWIYFREKGLVGSFFAVKILNSGPGFLAQIHKLTADMKHIRSGRVGHPDNRELDLECPIFWDCGTGEC